jgi:hypothetical protein
MGQGELFGLAAPAAQFRAKHPEQKRLPAPRNVAKEATKEPTADAAKETGKEAPAAIAPATALEPAA